MIHNVARAILASACFPQIYVALFPCNECAKLVIQSGIREVIFLSDKYHDDVKSVASRRMFDMAGVRGAAVLFAHRGLHMIDDLVRCR